MEAILEKPQTTPLKNTTHTGVFFPNLNGLRFIAAGLVIIQHLEILKGEFGMKNISTSLFIATIGDLGVTLFFVLSGFLITYLLLVEKEKYGQVSLSKFYTRRVLRIWPLYYLIVVLSFFVLPRFDFFYIPGLSETLADHYSAKLVLYLLILPNVASAAFATVPYAGQGWSIGVEEQFYLIWPLLIKNTQRYVEVLLVIVVFLVLLSNGLVSDAMVTLGHSLHWENPNWYETARVTHQFFKDLQIGCMAIGGLGAYLLFFQKSEVLKIVFDKRTQIFTYIILSIMFFRGLMVSREFYGLFFIIVILNLAANPTRLFSLEHPIPSYLGKISYGLYMYHNIAIIIAIQTVRHLFASTNTWLASLVTVPLTFAVTIGLASLSYHTLETYFMNMKKRFTRI